MLSFVIPAHNEEMELPATLRAIHAAGEALGQEYEVVVAADCCTDRTAEVAATHGAHVTSIDSRHISAARNAGWRSATGDRLIFVDADTRVSPAVVRQAAEAMESGAVGGGALINFEGSIPGYVRVGMPILLTVFRWAKFTGGCFFFARREALEKVGGWCERVYASEEIELARALKSTFGRRRFVIVQDRVATSARKLRTFKARELLGVAGKYLVHGRKVIESREHLDVWYGERRHDPETEARLAEHSQEKPR